MSADALVTSGDALRKQHGRLRDGAHDQQPSSTQHGPRSLIKTRRWPRSRLEEKKAAQRRRMQYLGRPACLVAPPVPAHWWQHHVTVESSQQQAGGSGVAASNDAAVRGGRGVRVKGVACTERRACRSSGTLADPTPHRTCARVVVFGRLKHRGCRSAGGGRGRR